MCFSIATDAVCCAGIACCQCACCCCKKTLGTSMKEQIKITYITLNTIMMLFTVFCLYWIQGGVAAVYRMSFVLACMYVILAICMLIRGEIARAINEGLWLLKFFYIAGFFFGCLYIPNSFFQWYIDFARVISGFYLVFQIIMLIDVFYLWGQSWMGSYEAGNQIMGIILILTSILLYGSALTLNIFNFIWFSGYGITIFINIFTIVMMVGITAIQLLGWNPQGSLICSGSMSIYITYEAYSAQSSIPVQNYNSLYDSVTVMSVDIVIGFILIIVALAYLTLAIKEQSQKSLKTGGGAELAANFLQTQSEKDEDKIIAQDEEAPLVQPPPPTALTQQQQLQDAKAIVKKAELAPYESNQYIFFHTIMFIVVIYMSMMITNWGAPSIDSDTKDVYLPSWASFWIKITTSWIAALIYIWTLIAPRIFPEREF